jgi:hypothetical protein
MNRCRILQIALLLASAAVVRAVEPAPADPLVPIPTHPLELLNRTPAETPLRLGPADLHLGLSASLTYDDNITLSAANERDDFIVRLVPQISVVMDREQAGEGSRLELAYRPLIWVFFDETDNNAVDHRLFISGRWSTAKLRLGLSQAYEEDSGAVVEAGRRLERRVYTTQLLGRYNLSEVTSFTLTPRLEIEEGRQIVDTRDWGIDAFVDHELSPKLRVGLGGSLGLWDREDNPSEFYERLLARATYNMSEKLDLGATVGVEFRQFDSDRSAVVTPVFGLNGNWRPRDSLTIALEAHARDEPSVLFDGLDYTTLGLSGQIRQRFAQRWFVSLAGGYDNRDYRSSVPGLVTTREDDFYFARAGAGVEFRNWSIGAYYLRQENDSTVGPQSFENNQVTLEVSAGF